MSKQNRRYKVIAVRNKNKLKVKRILQLIMVILLAIICIKIINSDNEDKEKLGETLEKTEEVAMASSTETNNSEESNINEYEIIESESSKLKTYEIIREDNEVKNYIESVMTRNGLSKENFGFFYYNVDIGSRYFFNEDNWFTAGSTIKVALAMMYYDKINDGEVTKNTTYKYSSDDYEEGDGLTDYTYSVGDSIPLSFLLEQMIINSDNTATNILISGMRTISLQKFVF